MRDNLGRFTKGHPEGKRFIKGFSPWNKDTKGVMVAWNKGKKMGRAWNYSKIDRTCLECKKEFKLSPAFVNEKGNCCSTKCSGIHRGRKILGSKHPNWVHDRSKLAKRDERNDSTYVDWRKQVWLRDNFTCKLANPDCEGKIQAHHILPWRSHKELRYEVNNGITLCRFHHPRKRNDEEKLAPLFRELVEKGQ